MLTFRKSPPTPRLVSLLVFIVCFSISLATGLHVALPYHVPWLCRQPSPGCKHKYSAQLAPPRVKGRGYMDTVPDVEES